MTLKTAWGKVQEWWKGLQPKWKAATTGFFLGYFIPLLADVIGRIFHIIMSSTITITPGITSRLFDSFKRIVIPHFFGIPNGRFIQLSLIMASISALASYSVNRTPEQLTMKQILKRISVPLLVLLLIFTFLEIGAVFQRWLGYVK